MFGADDLAFFGGGGNEGAAGQMVGAAEEAACALMDGRDGLIGKQGRGGRSF